jgi:hypothetical protein
MNLYAGKGIFFNDVGIGTIDPQAKLHVAGDYIRVDGAGGEEGYIGGDGAGNDVQIGSFDPTVVNVGLWNEATNSRMNLFAGKGIFFGNVGIGTTSPQAKLVVEVGTGEGGAAVIGHNSSSATGNYAIATGVNTTASGWGATSMGYGTIASNHYSVATGSKSIASGFLSTAMGGNTIASGEGSTAMGGWTKAIGHYSTAMGYGTSAVGVISTAMGIETNASGRYSTAMGIKTTASGFGSTTFGRSITASGNYSVGFGLDHNATGWTISDHNTMAIMGGNVGIGTTSPQQTLHVNGVMRLEPQSSEPAGSLGELYVNSNDGNLYFYGPSGWKEVRLMP